MQTMPTPIHTSCALIPPPTAYSITQKHSFLTLIFPLRLVLTQGADGPTDGRTKPFQSLVHNYCCSDANENK